jgi:hypothetical protein
MRNVADRLTGLGTRRHIQYNKRCEVGALRRLPVYGNYVTDTDNGGECVSGTERKDGVRDSREFGDVSCVGNIEGPIGDFDFQYSDPISVLVVVLGPYGQRRSVLGSYWYARGQDGQKQWKHEFSLCHETSPFFVVRRGARNLRRWRQISRGVA